MLHLLRPGAELESLSRLLPVIDSVATSPYQGTAAHLESNYQDNCHGSPARSCNQGEAKSKKAILCWLSYLNPM
jgi:hypothetical protein